MTQRIYRVIVDIKEVIDMMGGYGAGMGGFGSIGLLLLFTWVLLDVFLVLGVMYFWRELRKKK